MPTSGEFTLHASPANDITRTTDDALVISERNAGPLYGPDGDYSYNKAQRITSMGDDYILASGRAGASDPNLTYGLFKRNNTDWVTVDVTTDTTASMGGSLSSEFTYLEMAAVNDTTAIHTWRDSSDGNLHLQAIVRDGDTLSFGSDIVGIVDYDGFFYGSPTAIVPLNDTEFVVVVSGWVGGVGENQHLIHVTRNGTTLTKNSQQTFYVDGNQWVMQGTVAINENTVVVALIRHEVRALLLTRSAGDTTWSLVHDVMMHTPLTTSHSWDTDKFAFSSGAGPASGRVLGDTAAFAWFAYDYDEVQGVSTQYIATGIARVSGGAIVSVDSDVLYTAPVVSSGGDENNAPTIAAWKDTGIWVTAWVNLDAQQLHFYEFSTDGASITRRKNATFGSWSDWNWGEWLEALGTEGGAYGVYFETHNDGETGSGFGRLMTYGNPPSVPAVQRQSTIFGGT